MAAFGAPARMASAQALSLTKTQVTLVTRSGRYLLNLEVADSKPKADLGLRFRHSIPPDGGMLFLSYGPMIMSISTLGLTLQTDVLFIAKDGRIVEVHPWVPPNSDIAILSLSPVAAALQMAGGSVTRFGIGFGDRILSPRFGQSA